MNERIQELREQAAKFAEVTYSNYTMATFDTNKSIETLFEEKFAKLIVKKFDDILLLQHLDCIGNRDEKSAELIEWLRDKTKTYFGVEE